jgi:hypothetical protein
MGDRGQVKIISKGEPDLYFYSHWDAGSLPGIVAAALDRGRGRWGDDEYLNRIIFSEMIRDCVLEETGYGIGFSRHGDVWRVVEINYDDKTVAISEVDYDGYEVSSGLLEETWKYEQEPIPYGEFIAKYAKAMEAI